jgi:glycyl-tRNA synthetase beta chain
MPSFLLEFFSEEIPARMQKRAEDDLARMLHEKLLVGTGHASAKVRTLSGPRRIAIIVDDLGLKSDEPIQKRKGPKVGAPAQAIDGFLKSTGLGSIEEAQVVGEPGKQFYEATYRRPALAMSDVIKTVVPEIAKDFPWPKSMRSGSSDFIWVRPLHGVLCVFDGKPIAFEVGGVKSGAQTWGHRFHSSGAITIANAAEYEGKLRDAYVLADREARKAKILADAKAACAAKKVELVEDAGLLEEVAGLAEWPVVVLGDMDKAFLDLPAEVIRLTMRTHQRYFAVRDPKSGKLAPHFITVANVEPRDGGKAIAAGNARVLSARLNDARFFWDGDRKIRLEDRVAKLDQIVFHQKLGSVGDKVKRVRALARELAPLVGADPDLADRAALLAKADLVTEIVGEFPELQGQIGRQLFLIQNGIDPSPLAGEGREGGRAGKGAVAEAARPPPPAPSPQGGGEFSAAQIRSIATAIEDHYRPLGPNDRVPSDPVAIAVALADKLDTLFGFWLIDEKPTGSKDPFALRRAALGAVRMILALNVRMSPAQHYQWWEQKNFGEASKKISAFLAKDIVAFLADRLKVQLRDQGKRHDLVDAVFALGDDDLVRIVARVEALDKFLKTDDGANILAGYRRAANIIAAEVKKGQGVSEGAYDAGVLDKNPQPAERALLDAVNRIGPEARKLVEKEQFEAAMTALAGLRAPLDLFFEQVLVNDPNPDVRRNRLLLLTQIRDALGAVADFSKIEG